MPHRLRHHGVTRTRFAHVANGHFAYPARGADLVAHLAQIFLVAAGDQYGCALSRKPARDRSADPGGTAGYDGNFSFNAEWVFRVHFGFAFSRLRRMHPNRASTGIPETAGMPPAPITPPKL